MRFLKVVLITVLLALGATSASAQLLVLLDRTGSMGAVRTTGNTRCADARTVAQADVALWATSHPGGTVAVWTFANNNATDVTGGFVSVAQATAAIAALSPNACTGTTPLAEAMCDAVVALLAAFPELPAVSRTLAISSDGGENNSDGPCDGPNSTTPAPYDPGSWQYKVTNAIVGSATTNVRFWGSIAKNASSFVDSETGERRAPATASDMAFFQTLATQSGGQYYGMLDDMPVSTAVPTLSTWAMIILTVLIFVAGIFALRRRRASATV